MSVPEVKRKYKLQKSKPEPSDMVHLSRLPDLTIPPHFDLSAKMPPVLDQGELGSCASNAVSNIMRYLVHEEKKISWQPSRLYLYFNTRVLVEESPANEDTGVSLKDICKCLKMYSACDESIMPYNINLFSSPPSLACFKKAMDFENIKYSALPHILCNIEKTIASGMPILAGIQIYSSFESSAVSKSGTVPMPNKSKDYFLGGHAVVIVGYDQTTRLFKCMNSWGVSWGNKGFFTLPYDYVMDGEFSGDLWVISPFER